jgi:hypothetical protein
MISVTDSGQGQAGKANLDQPEPQPKMKPKPLVKPKPKPPGTVPKKMVSEYFADLAKNAEFPDTIVNDGSTWTKISTEQNDIMRTQFKKQKATLIAEWEAANDQKWPRYTEDVFTDSGKPLRKAGDLYDAHHIKPLEFGGRNSCDNITPIEAGAHFDKKGVHAPTSPFGKIESLYK